MDGFLITNVVLSALVLVASQRPLPAKPLQDAKPRSVPQELTPIGGEMRGVAGGWTDYDVDVASSGEAAKIVVRSARPDADRFSRWIRTDRFESCLRRWRFGNEGRHRVRLADVRFADAKNVARWKIIVTQDDREFVMIIP